MKENMREKRPCLLPQCGAHTHASHALPHTLPYHIHPPLPSPPLPPSPPSYLSLLDSHPIPTKALTAALLNLVGDLFCQVREAEGEREREWVGGLLAGGALVTWVRGDGREGVKG